MGKRNGVEVNVWMPIEDKEKLQRKAREAGLTMSEYIRRCAFGRKIQSYGDLSILKEYSGELGKIGSNLNQIAHHLNAGGSIYTIYGRLDEALKDFNDVRFRVLLALEDICCGTRRNRNANDADNNRRSA